MIIHSTKVMNRNDGIELGRCGSGASCGVPCSTSVVSTGCGGIFDFRYGDPVSSTEGPHCAMEGILAEVSDHLINTRTCERNITSSEQ